MGEAKQRASGTGTGDPCCILVLTLGLPYAKSFDPWRGGLTPTAWGQKFLAT